MLDLLYMKEMMVFAGFGLGLWLSLLATALYYGGGSLIAQPKKIKSLDKRAKK